MYGKTPIVAPLAIPAALPVTGASDNLFILAAGMLALGVVVYLVASFLARKSGQASEI
ncbi:MAG TPA: LPXTG cell wall anchor domain-containing protein [Candidatus Saccharimonadales bacterium]|jgi:LPXTG-motif cell wall-anchored protein|nr:LPXTG cell wall anchor domain-containing protein [Candidatus Saccharimonadales bacterium]